MYKILIVDDELNERMGIKGLINKYKYPLEIKQAQNGKIALEIIKSEHIDILLTDIKMPFMTGIELIEEIQKLGLSPIFIIYSAYGEFEYAQNAISLGVLQYLLKPIKLDEFENLFNKVLKICKEENEKKKENEKLNKTLKSFENEKFNQKILSYLDCEKTTTTFQEIDNELLKNTYQPIIISAYSILISKYWELYKQDISLIIGNDSIIITKRDTQLLLLMKNKKQNNKSISQICKELINISKSKYQSEVFIVAGRRCHNMQDLKVEYTKMLEQLDYQFFVTESMFLTYNENGIIKKTYKMLSLYFERILTFAKLRDYEGMYLEFQNTFEYVENSEGFSSIYIKYNFSEVIKKCCEILNSEERMMQIIQDVYNANSIVELKNAIFSIIDTLSKNNKKENDENRLVILIKDIIQERFSDYNLNVSLIANEINMSAAYLSTLFKIETSQNLTKYISQYRLEKSKELLKTTNMKIVDIAKKVGYINPSYFISLFKNNFGCSPSKYRENFLKND